LDIQDFWRRWHITLSRFLRDYIYIPLGGNRKGSFRTYSNILATFVIGGIWHGAGWTFVFWGFLHGMALVIHRFWKTLGFTMPKILAWFITFNFINIAWVFFRAKEWEDAVKVLSGMFGGVVVLPLKLEERLDFLSAFSITFGSSLGNISGDHFTFMYLLIAFLTVLLLKNSSLYTNNFVPSKKLIAFSTFTLTISILMFNRVSEFLYFNF
jgi:hypothetical protein